MLRPFRDRQDAGRQLAAMLGRYANRLDVRVLALPRGGVPVGHEVARHLGAPLDVFVVRKLGVPGHAELAMGAIAAGVEILNRELIEELAIPFASVMQVAQRERDELRRREQAFREGRELVSVKGQTVIIVDDGLATGSTMEAAVSALKGLGPARIVVAVPVGAAETCQRLSAIADEVVCAVAPIGFRAVGEWYDDFSQTTDEEVRALLSGR